PTTCTVRNSVNESPAGSQPGPGDAPASGDAQPGSGDPWAGSGDAQRGGGGGAGRVAPPSTLAHTRARGNVGGADGLATFADADDGGGPGGDGHLLLPPPLSIRRPTESLPSPHDYGHWREPSVGEEEIQLHLADVAAASGNGAAGSGERAAKRAPAGEGAESELAADVGEAGAHDCREADEKSDGLFVLRNALLAELAVEWTIPPSRLRGSAAAAAAGAGVGPQHRVRVAPGQSRRFGASAHALGLSELASRLWSPQGLARAKDRAGVEGEGALESPPGDARWRSVSEEGVAGGGGGGEAALAAEPVVDPLAIWAMRTRLLVAGFEPLDGVSLREVGCHARLLVPVRARRPSGSAADGRGRAPEADGVPVVLEVCRLPGGQRLLCVRAPFALRNACGMPLALTTVPAGSRRPSRDGAAASAQVQQAAQRKTAALRAGARLPLAFELARDGGKLELDVSHLDSAGPWRRARADPAELPFAGSGGRRSRGVQAVTVAECVERLTECLQAARGAAGACEREGVADSSAEALATVAASAVGPPGFGAADGEAESTSACVTVTVTAQPLLSGGGAGITDVLVTVRSALSLANKLAVAVEFELWPSDAAGGEGFERDDVGWGAQHPSTSELFQSATSERFCERSPPARGWPAGARGHRIVVGSGESAELAPVLTPGCQLLVVRLRPAGGGEHAWSSLVRVPLRNGRRGDWRDGGVEFAGLASFLHDDLRALLRLERGGGAAGEMPLTLVAHAPVSV
ncbi:hypothetical protein T492DRAFT_865842, partial [Pavlovales sp. CCMP2436]